MVALKLARTAGLLVILSSSSDEKLKKISDMFSTLPLSTVNYARNPSWEEDVLGLTAGMGVDLVIENGGTGSLVKSMKCTRRGGMISQVGYLGKQDPQELVELLPFLIDRRVTLRYVLRSCRTSDMNIDMSANFGIRGINVGSKHDMEDLCAALSATQLHFNDVIDSVYSFDKAEEAIEYIWQGKQVGKIVIRL